MVNNHEMSAQFGEWVIAKDHLPSIAYVVLSAFAAVVSYLIARLFHLPEAYWAPMSTLIVMKLTLSAALPIAVQYVVGTALQARGLTENPFLHAWTEFGERKCLGQPEFPQQWNENRVDENLCQSYVSSSSFVCRDCLPQRLFPGGGRTTIRLSENLVHLIPYVLAPRWLQISHRRFHV